jgi:predicted nucleic acid-binding protein
MSFAEGQRAVVVDASVTIPFLDGNAVWVDRWRSWIQDGSMILAPAHFGHEVANALLRGSGSRDLATVAALVGHLFDTGFEIADRGHDGLQGALRLAERHGLTVYDAAYLDLVIDVDGELATSDRELAAAAKAEGVPVTS